MWLVQDLGRVVVRRRSMVDRKVKADARLQVTGADLSARDNAALAVATSTMVGALSNLRDRCIIDDKEFLRMAYRFAGEVADVEALLARGKKAGPRDTSDPQGRIDPKNGGGGVKPVEGKPAGVKIDGETGEEKGIPKIE